jgi:fucose permease
MTKNNYLKSTPIFLAFLVMGFGDVSGPLTSQLQTDFSLSNFQAGQFIAFVIIFIIGLGFANIFPHIFSITVDAYPDRSNEISGLMITAIIGGAFVPILVGACSRSQINGRKQAGCTEGI